MIYVYLFYSTLIVIKTGDSSLHSNNFFWTKLLAWSLSLQIKDHYHLKTQKRQKFPFSHAWRKLSRLAIMLLQNINQRSRFNRFEVTISVSKTKSVITSFSSRSSSVSFLELPAERLHTWKKIRNYYKLNQICQQIVGLLDNS